MLSKFDKVPAASLRQTPGDCKAHAAWFRLRHALCRQHVLDFGGPNAKCQRAKGPVGAGVAIAADHGHARLRQPQLRPNDMHDALPARSDVEQRNACAFAIAPKGRDLLGRDLVLDVKAFVGSGGNVVIAAGPCCRMPARRSSRRARRWHRLPRGDTCGRWSGKGGRRVRKALSRSRPGRECGPANEMSSST